MSGHEKEKTCADCKCRDCSLITAMAERMDAWKSAESLLKREWGEDYSILPTDIMILADWLLYGPGPGGDDKE